MVPVPDYAIEMEWAIEHEKFFYKAYNPWRYENHLAGFGLQAIDSLTFGFEFRFLRRLNLIPEMWLDKIELIAEKVVHRFSIPYFSKSGWMYVGLFKKIN